MSQIEISEASADLRGLAERARAGEDVVLVADGEEIARIVPPVQSARQATPARRQLGRLNGLYKIPDDFDAPLPDDILDLFEGKA